MSHLFLMVLVILTSLTAYALGVKQHGMRERSLSVAFLTILECVGTFSVFLVINLGLGALIILLIRTFTPIFVSLYVMEDLMLVFLSVLQGFLFQLWWHK